MWRVLVESKLRMAFAPESDGLARIIRHWMKERMTMSVAPMRKGSRLQVKLPHEIS